MGSEPEFNGAVACTETLDTSIDVTTLALLKDALQYLYDVRDSRIPPGPGPTPILRQWLEYLSVLMDTSVCGIVCLALHNQALLSSTIFRLPFEYLVRTLYFTDHPEEARFQAFYIARDQLTFATETKLAGPQLAEFQNIYDEALIECPDIATKRKPKPVQQMLLEYSHDHNGTYPNMYRARSGVIHGTAFGMTALREIANDGSPAWSISISKGYQNALLVDLVGYVIAFTERYCVVFECLDKDRIAELNDVVAMLRLRYSEGRADS